MYHGIPLAYFSFRIMYNRSVDSTGRAITTRLEDDDASNGLAEIIRPSGKRLALVSFDPQADRGLALMGRLIASHSSRSDKNIVKNSTAPH